MNLHRFLALCHKEFCQMLRDPSSFLIGIVIPLMLIILMGSGLSLDVKDLPVAVALEDSSPTARSTLHFLDGSPYFSPHYVSSISEAAALMDARQADAIIADGKAAAEAERASKLRQADAQIADLTRTVCAKVLERNLTQQDDERLLADLLQKAGESDGKRV